ncbi:hypothetical protein [Rhodococcus sp. YH3-3]|uniref:hypothetical protein n=1 Tax=Rhodococcus sp. YH3-3 TaxID=1803579 RepID=UPI00187D195B|nr:hypothetical protein [Rhodococcus sp. YH3-3]
MSISIQFHMSFDGTGTVGHGQVLAAAIPARVQSPEPLSDPLRLTMASNAATW